MQRCVGLCVFKYVVSELSKSSILRPDPATDWIAHVECAWHDEDSPSAGLWLELDLCFFVIDRPDLSRAGPPQILQDPVPRQICDLVSWL